jgi:hypothetical protein
VLSTLEEPPPKGQAVWDGPALGEALENVSPCGLACAAERRHMFGKAAQLGRQHDLDLGPLLPYLSDNPLQFMDDASAAVNIGRPQSCAKKKLPTKDV